MAVPSLKRTLGCAWLGWSLVARPRAQRVRRRRWLDAAVDHHPAVDVLDDRVDDGAGGSRRPTAAARQPGHGRRNAGLRGPEQRLPRRHRRRLRHPAGVDRQLQPMGRRRRPHAPSATSINIPPGAQVPPDDEEDEDEDTRRVDDEEDARQRRRRGRRSTTNRAAPTGPVRARTRSTRVTCPPSSPRASTSRSTSSTKPTPTRRGTAAFVVGVEILVPCGDEDE